MSEQITITISVDQAEAVIDAINAMELLAEDKLPDIMSAYVPKKGPDDGASDRHLLLLAGLAQEVADMLRPEVEGAMRRDPEAQDIIHRIKMFRKYNGEL
jgi:hypothetical protein